MRGLIFLFSFLVLSSALAQPAPPPPPLNAPRPAGAPHSCLSYYPPAEAQAHVEGRTLVAFTIKTDGTVTDVSVARSSGNSDLDNAAMTCVKTWLYRPVLQNGQAVELPWKAFVNWQIVPGAPN